MKNKTTSYHQAGGITAETVNIKDSEVKLTSNYHKKNEGVITFFKKIIGFLGGLKHG